MLESAINIAQKYHKGQIRKFKNEPYIYHPIAVAEIVALHKESKNINDLLKSAICHDLLEDTNISYIELEDTIGKLAASIVKEMTNDINKLKKKEKSIYLLDKMISMTSYALVIKLADRFHNITDLEFVPKQFKVRYMDETFYIINNLIKERPYISNTHFKLIAQIDNKLNSLKKI